MSALLENGRRWKEHLLRQLFSEDEVSDISIISFGGAGTEDYLAWNYTKNGDFSARSAYHLKMRLKRVAEGSAESSSSSSMHKGWLNLWGSQVR